jgi:hypothetical protein
MENIAEDIDPTGKHESQEVRDLEWPHRLVSPLFY